MSSKRECAVLVGLAIGGRDRERAERSLEELKQLAEASGARVVGQVLQDRKAPDPATLIGRGKVQELARLREEEEVDLFVFDDDLSPAQQRNIEKAVEAKTVDRTQLILDIFAKRAKTREGRLQVELAQLDYMLPRLSGHGILLSRLGGGIGTRGPGETKLETDRRRIRQRILAVRREIEHVRKERDLRRDGRRRNALPTVALVGYTNAGKSTLFKALTREAVQISDQVFMTLDPLVRRVRLGPCSDMLLVDTVGFIQKLPHQLVDAFRATLEEVCQADLLLHIIDASAEDCDQRAAAVEAVLREIGADERPQIEVLNKTDRLTEQRSEALRALRPSAVAISARSGEGLEALEGGAGPAVGPRSPQRTPALQG